MKLECCKVGNELRTCGVRTLVDWFTVEWRKKGESDGSELEIVWRKVCLVPECQGVRACVRAHHRRAFEFSLQETLTLTQPYRNDFFCTC